MKLNKISLLAIVALLSFPLAALAFTFSDGKNPLPDRISDDFYTASQNVTLDTPVYGDMIAAGGQMAINAPVSQDLTLAGGNISIEGEIGDDARIAGGDIRIDSIIKGDLLAGGGSIVITEQGFVGGDFVFGGGSVRIEGVVNGKLLGTAGELFINNEIKGDVRLLNAEKITFGPKGKVLGDFSYHSPEASTDVTPDTVKGKIDYSATEIPFDRKDFGTMAWGIFSGFSIFGFLSLLFSGLFLLWALRFLMLHAVGTGNQKPLPSLGIGFLVAFAIPFLVLMLLFTGVGLSMAFAVLMGWLILLFIGKLVGVLTVGMHLVKIDEKSSFPKLYLAFAMGALAFSLLAIIPILGWILRLLLNLLGLGSLLLVLAGLYQTSRKKGNL